MKQIEITTEINAPANLIFDIFFDETANMEWNNAGNGWNTPFAKLERKAGGLMQIGYLSDTGGFGFLLESKISEIIEGKKITYLLADNRPITYIFDEKNGKTKVILHLTLENTFPEEHQRHGWSQILQHLKECCEKRANKSFRIITKKIHINAPREMVFKHLHEKKSYEHWTAPFCEGSTYQCDEWAHGKRIHFGTPSGDGMYSDITTFVPNHRITFKHLGEIKNHEELSTGEMSAWKNYYESYILRQEEIGCSLEIYSDSIADYYDYLNNAWDESLKRLKTLSEAAESQDKG